LEGARIYVELKDYEKAGRMILEAITIAAEDPWYSYLK
jgi:hypothetical protein